MAITYERYLKLNIDSSLIGFEHVGKGGVNYFCTPKGAKVIGQTGTDGIHFCSVSGFGRMVFAVSPMNTPGNYVHPIARDFPDFLRLLLSCGDASIPEQVYCWNEEQFDAFLQGNPLSAEQQAVLDTIREKLMLSPIEKPFAYIKELQAGFDYSRIKYTEDYYEWVPEEPKIPEWKVYFNGSFWGKHSRERAGKEIPINKQFVWSDKSCHIPAIYNFGKGLVADLCIQVPAESIYSFMGKWQLSADSYGSNYTEEQHMQINAENPLVINISPKIVINGAVLPSSNGTGISWNPCFPDRNSLEAESAIRHYKLDSAYGWIIQRFAFPWGKKRKPLIKTLSLTLVQDPVPVAGPHFHISAPSECIKFTHPVTGTKHTLTIHEYQRQEISGEHFGSQNYEFPTHYTAMSYALSPDMPNSAFTVTDCVCSDQPRQKSVNPKEPQASCSVCIGIIGGGHGLFTLISHSKSQDKLHAVCSALHFIPAEDVEWRMTFYERKSEDITVELLQA
ncbi:hypothetical protein LY28_00168 [Ruminiclostridium sufflavum DSM 19573]|uniref:Uncharacterized protein n=1 Tax=Ruminiclostridium sufflavum DSM 19573 TaxID=1121337 RepID=A0A318XRR7_9FIRM|nr:hypothetical protein [Ruminiclostridium sufflavum]PYG90287.1 hypothetical protein LY28_00168 [Ruminiclostridium sufflavum DSM 19573]